MRCIVIDSGTTNTRLYLVDETGAILAEKEEKIGARDTSLSNNGRLRAGIERMYWALLRETGTPNSQIAFVTASGMITSEIGLLDLPHLIAPAGLDELARGIVVVDDPRKLDLGKPVYFIRGIKNCRTEDLPLEEFLQVDFMRGEEVQYQGILQVLGLTGPCNIITLSSHTKICYMDDQGRVAFSKTTISGQVYEALLQHTFIGKSVQSAEAEPEEPRAYERIVQTAVQYVQEAGLLNAFMVPRFMEVLSETTAAERKLFVNAAIAADDLRAIAFMQHSGRLTRQIVVYGKADRCRLYAYLLKQMNPDCEVIALSDKRLIASCTVHGSCAIAKRRKELEEHVPNEGSHPADGYAVSGKR